jgi:TPR repeat protein
MFSAQAPAQTAAELKNFSALKAKAEKGDAEAQLALAGCYSTGTGTSRDPAKAARWHRKAAEQGLARAQLLVGFDYANGYGMKPDNAQAFKWMRLAAEQGLAEAQLDLGLWLAKGMGVRPDAVEAVKWFRLAADQGLSGAEYALGKSYFEGDGVPKNIVEGLRWTRRAAEEGYASAQNSLGLCYLKGEGVPKDYVQAYKWFNLAAGQGDEDVYDIRVNLAKVEGLLTTQQIAEAQRLAREFKPGKASTSDAPSSAEGTVNVKGDDEGCEVFVDGAFVGSTPARLKLSEGMHVVEVKRTGFKDYRREIKVTNGAELSLHPVLEKP